LLIYILKAEIVNDGRKEAERTNSKVQEAFPAGQWFQDAHRFPWCFSRWFIAPSLAAHRHNSRVRADSNGW